MGTAVLRAQDYLARSQSDRDHNLLFVTESSASAARPCGTVFSATHHPSLPAAKLGRDAGPGNASANRRLNLVGRKTSAAGLLPLPDQASESTCHCSLAPKVSSCSFGDSGDAHGSKLFGPSQRSNFTLYAPEVCISRRPSVPMFEHVVRTQRFYSARLPLHSLPLHEGDPLQHDAKCLLSKSRDNAMVDSFPSACGRAISCQKLKFWANSHFCHVPIPTQLQRANSLDYNMHYRKRVHPESAHGETYMGRQYGKPPLPDEGGRSTCTRMRAVGRKFSVSKQLKRSGNTHTSEQLHEGLETLILKRSGTSGAARKPGTNLFEGTVGFNIGKCGRREIENEKPTSRIGPVSSSELEIEKGQARQASFQSMGSSKTGVVGSLEGSLSQKTIGNTKVTGASFHRQRHDRTDAMVEQQEVYALEHEYPSEGDELADIERLVSVDQDDQCRVDATSVFNNQSAGSNKRTSGRVSGSGGISGSCSSDSRSCSSVSDNKGMWVSMMNDERWAGPSFSNSPSPSALPVPSFAFLSSKTFPSSEITKRTVNYGVHMIPDELSKWDVAFATKDLRRILHLDHTPGDSQ